MLSEEIGSMKIIILSVGETRELIVLGVYGSGSWLAHCRMEVQWNLFSAVFCIICQQRLPASPSQGKTGSQCVCFPIVFSVLYENNVILDNVVQISSVIIKQVQLLYLIGDLCCR